MAAFSTDIELQVEAGIQCQTLRHAQCRELLVYVFFIQWNGNNFPLSLQLNSRKNSLANTQQYYMVLVWPDKEVLRHLNYFETWSKHFNCLVIVLIKGNTWASINKNKKSFGFPHITSQVNNNYIHWFKFYPQYNASRSIPWLWLPYTVRGKLVNNYGFCDLPS